MRTEVEPGESARNLTLSVRNIVAKSLVCLLVWAACSLDPAIAQEVIDPQKAEQNPDFLVQGEYSGQGLWPDGERVTVGAQVVALGNNRFRAILYRGGLPGNGWKRGDDKFALDGKLVENTVRLTGDKRLEGQLRDRKLVLTDEAGEPQIELKRTERKSPTLGSDPPETAVVLFDGGDAEQFAGGKMTDMGTLEAGCSLKGKYRVQRLHLEFRLSWKPKARGQGRSNSGVFVASLPEIQVLDSFGLEGRKNECGALYGKRRPDVNMCFPPLTWQTYDVEFHRPDPRAKVQATIRHNGVVIHADYETGRNDFPLSGLKLQRHGNRVQYRNIWLVEPRVQPNGSND